MIAFIFLAGWLYTMYGTADLDQRYPPIGEITEIDGNLIHYTDSGGEGRPVILLHGASSNLRDFSSSLVNPLAHNYRVIAIDRPGFGNSTRRQNGWLDPTKQAAIVHQLLIRLGAQNPVLIGHSWSGALVLSYLLEFPGHGSGAILITPAIYPWYDPASVYNRIAGVPVVGKFLAHTLVFPVGKLVLGPGIRKVLSPGEMPDGYRKNAAIDTMLRPSTFLANAEDLRNLNDYLVRRSVEYNSITTPILAIIGDNDSVVSNTIHTAQLKTAIPAIRVLEIENSGHAPHQTHSDQVTGLIKDFVNKL